MRKLLVIALVLASCGGTARASATPTPFLSPSRTGDPSASPSPASSGRSIAAIDAQRLIGARVVAAMDVLKRHDGAGLSALAHPTKGIRFSPYPFVQPTKDIVLMKAEIAGAYTDTRVRTWGITDGKGDPITTTFANYDKLYVWSRDFLASSQTAYNKTIGFGNSVDNTADIYPAAILFEAYDPGPDPALKDVQWQCLRLLFEPQGSEWYLVGVVHGQWTI